MKLFLRLSYIFLKSRSQRRLYMALFTGTWNLSLSGDLEDIFMLFMKWDSASVTNKPVIGCAFPPYRWERLCSFRSHSRSQRTSAKFKWNSPAPELPLMKMQAGMVLLSWQQGFPEAVKSTRDEDDLGRLCYACHKFFLVEHKNSYLHTHSRFGGFSHQFYESAEERGWYHIKHTEWGLSMSF